MNYKTYTVHDSRYNTEISVTEIDYDYDLHAFRVTHGDTDLGTVYPASLEEMEETRQAIEAGESPVGWDDGLGGQIKQPVAEKDIRLYQIIKTEPVARRTVREIIWQGHSLLKAVESVVDKHNYSSQIADSLSYYSIHEVTPADIEDVFTVADGDKIDINFTVDGIPYKAHGLAWSASDLDNTGQDFTDAFYSHVLQIAEEDLD